MKSLYISSFMIIPIPSLLLKPNETKGRALEEIKVER